MNREPVPGVTFGQAHSDWLDLGGRFDWPSGLIGLAAAIALFQLGVIPVIAGSAGAGPGYQLAHAALYAAT